MKHTILKLVTAAMIISATALFVGGCSNKAQDIDLTLIGGDGQDIETDTLLISDTILTRLLSTATRLSSSLPRNPKKSASLIYRKKKPLLRKPHRLQPRQHSRLSP